MKETLRTTLWKWH